MNNLDNARSVLSLKKLYFSKISFVRDIYMPKNFTTSFKPEYKDISSTEIEVKLQCRITSDTEFVLEIELVGCFENSETDPVFKEELNKLNTVSIMFPYLRSEISLITAQPNFPTIDLPVVNINALLEEQGQLIGNRA